MLAPAGGFGWMLGGAAAGPDSIREALLGVTVDAENQACSSEIRSR